MKQVITDIESNLQKGDSDLSKGINVGLKTAVALIIRGMEGNVIVPIELLDELLNGQGDGKWYHGTDMHDRVTAMLSTKGEKG